ncbi:MAG TPA: glycosyltransferase, partial [Kineosporiaceae bacterium]|nr:glycosyltransferase [Kineosporiaceae bacterium]
MTLFAEPESREQEPTPGSAAGRHAGTLRVPDHGQLDPVAHDAHLRDADAGCRGHELGRLQLAPPVNATGPSPRVALTVVVPTRDEVDNVAALLERLGPPLSALGAEILFVDDSDDDTPDAIRTAAAVCTVPVRLLHRPPGCRRGGLSSAVVAGARVAAGDWVLVMDADLQHPPEDAVRLGRAAVETDADVVIGTRYAGAGSGDGLDGWGRGLVSSAATAASRAAFPRCLATVSDPMSGLFAFRRTAIDLDRLHAIGFKILLEILVRHPSARVAEVAYTFAPRHAGTSKATVREGMAFVRHLLRLRRHVLARQLNRAPVTRAQRMRQAWRGLGFGLVGLSGLLVNSLAFWFGHSPGHLHTAFAAVLATQASTLWNFLLIDLVVYRGPKGGTRAGRGLRFWLMNNALLPARIPALELLIAAGIQIDVANVVTLVLLFLLRFLVSDRVIYGSRSAAAAPTRDPVRVLVDSAEPAADGSRRRSQYLTYRYDVAGVVTIGSQIPLPELEFFRAQWIADADVDIAVRVGDVGRRRPRHRATMTQIEGGTAGEPVTIRYEEHLGRWGANFRVELGESVTITVGPLLARSPHVVYTNILEALLRFVMVSRGRMLLHSACVEIGGVGVMLSALTDTGKTATVLRLLREHGGKFLSDDMTLVDAEGNAVCFPKPLTISAHTLRAVQADDLSRSEWRRLQLQSRLHSKGGRSFAMVLARFNLPIMGINAITQMLVPPPKYSADRLVSCRMGSTTRVRDLFIIERGTPRLTDLDRADTLRRMLTNTDDAYGFPPFRYLAPAIVIGGLGYRQLRAREEQILQGFLEQVRTRVVASDCFGWADVIPQLLQQEYGLDLDGLDGWDPALAPGGGRHVAHAAATPVPAVVDLRPLPDEWPHWAVASTGA